MKRIFRWSLILSALLAAPWAQAQMSGAVFSGAVPTATLTPSPTATPEGFDADLQAGNDAYLSGDYSDAFESYLSAAQKGSGKAAQRLGFMYERGLGVKKNAAKAMKWYDQAAALGIDQTATTPTPTANPLWTATPTPTPIPGHDASDKAQVMTVHLDPDYHCSDWKPVPGIAGLEYATYCVPYKDQEAFGYQFLNLYNKPLHLIYEIDYGFGPDIKQMKRTEDIDPASETLVEQVVTHWDCSAFQLNVLDYCLGNDCDKFLVKDSKDGSPIRFDIAR